MAQHDVYLLPDGGYVLDCQQSRFDGIGTRFVVPLFPAIDSLSLDRRLNPTFDLSGEALVMVTQFATSLSTGELRRRVGNLEHERDRIVAAIDTLIGAG